MTGDWWELYNEELLQLCSSLCKIRLLKSRLRLAEHAERIGKTMYAYRILVGEPEEKRNGDNIKTDLREYRVLSTGSVWLRIGTSERIL
jgi:hypothetical protein